MALLIIGILIGLLISPGDGKSKISSRSVSIPPANYPKPSPPPKQPK